LAGLAGLAGLCGTFGGRDTVVRDDAEKVKVAVAVDIGEFGRERREDAERVVEELELAVVQLSWWPLFGEKGECECGCECGVGVGGGTDVGKEGIKEGESVVEELGNVALELVVELVVRGRGGIGLVLEL